MRHPLSHTGNHVLGQQHGDNLFENNRFASNPFTYTIGADRAANCSAADFKPNVWRNNQADVAGVDIEPQRYGYCVRHE